MDTFIGDICLLSDQTSCSIHSSEWNQICFKQDHNNKFFILEPVLKDIGNPCSQLGDPTNPYGYVVDTKGV